MTNQIIPIEKIESKIYVIRNQRVMLDSDLAEMYGTETRVLNQAVNRNMHRFPSDFMFQLTGEEYQNLISQFVTSSSKKWGGRRKLPFVFTEHGAVMLASVLNSKIAIEASIHVVRAFISQRELLATHKDLAMKLEQLENKSDKHDKEIRLLFDAIKRLMQPSNPPMKKIGFKRYDEK